MNKIDEQIKWYAENSNSLYDDMVNVELEKINSLYHGYEDHSDEIFVEEMIESFCKIIERQREKISDLETELSSGAMDGVGNQPLGQSFIATVGLKGENATAENMSVAYIPTDGFQSDEQLQAAFTQHCLINGSSSYTVNDYCSRIKKLWKSYEDDYRNGKLGDGLASKYPQIPWDGILMNAYHNVEALGEYVQLKIDQTDANRNWLNTRAALKKFDKFKALAEK